MNPQPRSLEKQALPTYVSVGKASHRPYCRDRREGAACVLCLDRGARRRRLGTGRAVQWLVRWVHACQATSGAGVSEDPERDRASPQWVPEGG